MHELDLLLGRFADAHLGTLTDDELARFEELLNLPDPELYRWLTGEALVPPGNQSPLLQRIIAFHRAS
jgi:antitoxin CptB